MSALQEVLSTRLVDPADVARVLGTTPRSVQRWQGGSKDPTRREHIARMLELRAVLELAGRTMPADSAAMWLRAPIPDLGYDKPLELVRDGDFRRVIASLTALAEGICQ